MQSVLSRVQTSDMTQQRSRAVPREEAGKVACLLCGGLISVSGGDRARFVDHMSNEHDAKTDCHDLLLAACVLDPRLPGLDPAHA